MRTRVSRLVLGLGLGLLAMGALRAATLGGAAPRSLAGLVTPAYVALVVAFTVALVRAGLPLNRLGFGVRPGPRHLLLAVAGVAALRLLAVSLDPLWEHLLGAPRDLERFSGAAESAGGLARLLVLSWTIAAFGEELTFRIVLMRGISFVLGDSRRAQGLALVLQALVFGLIHTYQGPTGVASSATHGIVFGLFTLAGRWSIWPAALAHGINNTIGILSLSRG